jgi:hypothetical protein
MPGLVVSLMSQPSGVTSCRPCWQDPLDGARALNNVLVDHVLRNIRGPSSLSFARCAGDQARQ